MNLARSRSARDVLEPYNKNFGNHIIFISLRNLLFSFFDGVFHHFVAVKVYRVTCIYATCGIKIEQETRYSCPSKLNF